MKFYYFLFTIKRYVEQVLMYLFIVIGKIIAYYFPMQNEYDIFFFFPSYTIGGAERVNAEIIKSFPDKKIIIFFTKNSANDGMLHFFKLPNVDYKEINIWTDNKWKYWNNLIFRGVCSAYINRQKTQPEVFIGQCNFGYKLTPHLKREIRIHELIHMYDPRFTWVWAPFIQFIDTRILLGNTIKETFKKAYFENGIPKRYLDRITIIPNCLEYIPKTFYKRTFELPLKIYYAGRGGPQKRIWLIIKIIQECRFLKLPVEFKLAGSFKDELPIDLINDGTYVGELKGGEEMYEFHKKNDLLLMTSAWEGFPMVIMEAMAFGAIVLVTDVDGIPDYIIDDQNGFLLNSKLNEDELIKQAIQKVKYLTSNLNLLNDISPNAFIDACEKFSPSKFRQAYREILL